ncbi:MAG: mannose-1-phosphate guanyltransferase [Phycisphaeraceae bacterium]|nr:mannose-1-phosphate guanyltransferase [Phycisphaeraceae bacterium]
MRHAMIMAGGAGTRLWPMSRAKLPKQLIPFIGGKSLLQVAVERLHDVVPTKHRYICASRAYQDAVLKSIPEINSDQYYGEPMGRDTLNAIGFVAADLVRQDPDAILAVFTADHLIEPVDRFRETVDHGFQVVEKHPNALVTLGIKPTHPATSYGYLKLGSKLNDTMGRSIEQYKEKPDANTAKQYFDAGADSYLWSGGMFVWRAQTMMEMIKRFAADNYLGLDRIGQQYRTDQGPEILDTTYPQLQKISIDYAVMEPASQDPQTLVVAIPLEVEWLDIGSWPSFAKTCDHDEQENAIAAEHHILMDSQGTLVASNDDKHLITTIGCRNLIVVHTPDATLVCQADQAERIKQLHEKIGEQLGTHWL